MMIFLTVLHFISEGWSEPVFNIDDTGDIEEEYTLEYADLWPAKVVLDSTAKKCKLVWFDTDTPRHTDIAFDDIARLKLIPQYEGHPNELQIHLKDGRSFLLDMGPQVRKTAQTFTVLTKVSVESGSEKVSRIIPKPKPEREKPVLSIGSVESPEALLPPSKSTINDVKQVEVNYEVNETSFDYIVKSNMSRFRQCYLSKEDTQQLSGTVELEVTLDDIGSVSKCSVKSSTLHNSLVENCLIHQMKGLQFHPPKENKNVQTYPFILGN